MRRLTLDRDTRQIGGSMTPMIDVVFLLIVFFMLVAQLSRQQRVDLDLAALDRSAADPSTAAERAVINVLPGSGVRIGARAYDDSSGLPPEGVGQLARALADLPAGTPAVVRAAADTPYARAHAAMRAAADAGFATVELAVDAEDRR